MFSKPFRAVFYILAQAFMTLYHMAEDWEPSDEHAEFTGADMAARTVGDGPDNPATGTELSDNRTNVPEQVFNSGADVAAVFQPPAPPAPEPVGEPVYTMTEAAGTFSKQDYNVQGWTDQQLIDSGYMTVSYPKPVPAPPTSVPQPPAPPAPPSAQSNNTAAISTPGGVEGAVPALDADGLPWDARIHSGSKKRTEKNIWARRKNVPDATFNQIRAELLQRPFAAPQAAHVPLVPPVAPAAQPPAPAPVPPAPPGNANAVIQQAITDGEAAQAAKNNAALMAPQPTTGKELMTWASQNGLGHLFQATAQHVGVMSFGFLVTPQATPEQIVKAYTYMVERIASGS